MEQRREVCFIIGRGEGVLWCDASSNALYLPDSRARWTAIWDHRQELEEIAHSHPLGPLAFSGEDESTMEALCSALGKPVTFSVVAPHGMIRRQAGKDATVLDEPWWALLIRLASGMEGEHSRGDS
jgi:hypothetical protein